MLSLKKDSTISSKVSEYDNVPVLPANYHNYVAGPFPVPLFDTQPEPSQQLSPVSSSSPTSPVSPTHSYQERKSPPPVPRPLQFPTEGNQNEFDVLEEKQQREQRKPPSPALPSYQFPVEESQMGVDSLDGRHQQQQKQKQYESSLDHRLTVQHRKLPQQQQGQSRRDGLAAECASGRSASIRPHEQEQHHTKPR
ncbi:putative uncharacterized protein DDB_G0294196 [Eriocheir sinensis]|uniref:putative uncharacterized protein DDB_G0294196 n=1 Tax=Eriocheir sinensis TaxID=95602 RepID=UPI0021C70895|nr:putative uncharacterized protein DDB_G0294196 [Eriocheir sinensis]XP_050717020.1 putative uncharacterized protein DDB_G0294196 [Eriocheir sinensis]XP_050717027.1 putative uncharacterized protein DDB_G0294196 [Eriocheir sinensis]XP_050717030.1 putative uncharacterized protein DDB_G0294196 [Eriocheir sinensis]XP_050717039.1 putative uncharacterized protein DDB_G0294196 [Eriocheir sinensis]XP_050717045.1 putative uncharacterized protein DDB_G0294196 [Eriocheir sinensis]